MNYFLFAIFIFLFSCSNSSITSEDSCKNVNCEDYQSCEEGVCVVKDGFCSKNSDCLGNKYCDPTSHTCKTAGSCDGIVCEEFEICQDGDCVVKEGYCSKNSDCLLENGYCNSITHICETDIISSCEGISCINGECVVIENVAKCVCNSGYFNKTSFQCVEDTCLNRNEIGIDESSATVLNRNREEIKCYGKNDIYVANKKNMIISISESFTLTVYKNSISPENAQYINQESVFIENKTEENYFIVVNRDNYYRDDEYTIYYREGCSEDSNCPETYPSCVDSICVLPCENSECPDFYECVNGKCEEIICESHNDCPDSLCMSNHRCGYTKFCSEYYGGSSNCFDLESFDGDKFLCDPISYGSPMCIPYKRVTDATFSITEEFFANPRFAFWYRIRTTEPKNHKIVVTADYNGNQLRDKQLIYQEYWLSDGNLYVEQRDANSIDFQAKYMPTGEYYIYLLPYSICTGSSCENMNVTLSFDATENSTCSNDDVCKDEIVERSQCYSNGCVFSFANNVSVGDRCDLHENCTNFDLNYVDGVCFVKPTGGVCSIECGTHEGCEFENMNGYDYCVDIGGQGYCMNECFSDSDCIIGTFVGVCELDESLNVNLCRF
ncbi:hypothetical protein JXR93_09965 [bacterium]|nr:hypothetical protein [bacterium]